MRLTENGKKVGRRPIGPIVRFCLPKGLIADLREISSTTGQTMPEVQRAAMEIGIAKLLRNAGLNPEH